MKLIIHSIEAEKHTQKEATNEKKEKIKRKRRTRANICKYDRK